LERGRDDDYESLCQRKSTLVGKELSDGSSRILIRPLRLLIARHHGLTTGASPLVEIPTAPFGNHISLLHILTQNGRLEESDLHSNSYSIPSFTTAVDPNDLIDQRNVRFVPDS
jgi:hypothetical protein